MNSVALIIGQVGIYLAAILLGEDYAVNSSTLLATWKYSTDKVTFKLI